MTLHMTFYHFHVIIGRLNRLDRLPYILQRWKGALSVAVLVREGELDSLLDTITLYSPLSRIVFTVYVMKDITDENTPFYTLFNGTRLLYPNGFYPINTMRDLAIESISTTHCLIVDSDVFTSEGMESAINSFARELSNHRNIIVLTSFAYKKHPSLKSCYSQGDCKEAFSYRVLITCRWDNVPENRDVLSTSLNSGVVRYDHRAVYVLIAIRMMSRRGPFL